MAVLFHTNYFLFLCLLQHCSSWQINREKLVVILYVCSYVCFIGLRASRHHQFVLEFWRRANITYGAIVHFQVEIFRLSIYDFNVTFHVHKSRGSKFSSRNFLIMKVGCKAIGSSIWCLSVRLAASRSCEEQKLILSIHSINANPPCVKSKKL